MIHLFRVMKCYMEPHLSDQTLLHQLHMCVDLGVCVFYTLITIYIYIYQSKENSLIEGCFYICRAKSLDVYLKDYCEK